MFPVTPDRMLKMAKEKVVNYTAEQAAEMVSAYTAGDTVEAIAEKMGKSVRSVIAKLSREKVYVKKAYTTKTGESVVKKDAQADAIGELLGLSENDTESLTKANKSALAAIMDALTVAIGVSEAEDFETESVE